MSAENPAAGAAELSTTSSGRWLTTTTPPPVWIVREDQATSVAGGAAVDDEPGDVEDEDDGTVLVEGGALLLVDDDVGAVDVIESDVLGAGATCSGGCSLTWASAALTICHVRVVASAATSTHAPAIAHLLTLSFSQEAKVISSTRHQGFLKERGPKSTRG